MQMVKKNLNIVKILMKLNLKKSMMYRKSFFFTLFSSIIWLGVPLLMFKIIYLNVDTIAGWTWGEMIFLLGCFQIVDAIVMMLMITNMGTLEHDIRHGLLDKCLVKPIDAQLYYLVESFNFIQFTNIIFGLLLLIYSFNSLNIENSILLNSILLFIGLLFGIVIYVCLWFLVVISAFWFPANFSRSELVLSMNASSKYPRIIFEGLYKTIFSTILPLLLIVSPAVEVFLGKTDITILLYQGLVSFIFIFICRFVWKRGLMKYDSSN